MRDRIVVTGLGAVTPVGTGAEELWSGLLAGRSGFALVESFDTGRFNVHLGAEVRGFEPAAWVRTLAPAALGRASQLAVAAARMALADAGLEAEALEPERAGVSMGTTSGEPVEVERFDDRYLAGELDQVGPEFMGLYPCHMIAAHVGRELGFGGVNTMIPAACAAGNYAVAHALDGYGLSCDAHHMTAAHPEGDGAARAMERALADAGVAPEEVSYISAHGTGTPTNDRLETLAVKRVFGEGGVPPMSSVKSMLGHTMGAASAIESVVCALAIATGRVPPTMNYEEPDPECDLDVVPNAARELDVRVTMNNAYAFGGNNASVIFRSCEATA
jgi:3-oxoacyl-(acyl-carrier-protein) synthase